MKQFLFVAVLYEKSMAESLTVCSLLQRRDLLKARGIRVLVINNTPDIKPEVLFLENSVEYVSFGENRGLANAYQFAYLAARADKRHFLVLLDQDSEVTNDFICALDDLINDCGRHIGIWCPDVFSCGRPISPYSLNILGWPNFSPRSDANCLYGINSFSVVDTNFIEYIGGFNTFYWLDCLDLWLYERARQTGWKIGRLSTSVNHDLSLVSGEISLTRLKSIAYFEACFVVEFGTVFRIVGTIIRLGLRGIKRKQHIGGVYNYSSYFTEVLKGISIGLKRKNKKCTYNETFQARK
jgi:GT2 family glycosyltransferase